MDGRGKRKREEDYEDNEENRRRRIANDGHPNTGWCHHKGNTIPLSTERTTDDYDRREALTPGTFVQWYKVQDKQTRQFYAAKSIRIGEQWDGRYIHYMRLSLVLSHPNIVRAREVIRSPKATKTINRFWLVTELCDCDLRHLICNGRVNNIEPVFTEGQIKSVLFQLLSGLEYLHRQQIMHRDIAPQYIMFHDGDVKLRLSSLTREHTGGQLTPTVVRLWYRAPELLIGIKEYGFAIDMWSVGCIMAELFVSTPLFPGISELDQLAKVVNLLGPIKAYEWPELNTAGLAVQYLNAPQPTLTLPLRIPNLSRAALDLLTGLLCYNPHTRLTARQALQHEWFTQLPKPQYISTTKRGGYYVLSNI